MKRKLNLKQIKLFLQRFTFAWLCARSCSPLHVDYIVTLMALENRGVDSLTICESCPINKIQRNKII